MLLETVKIVRRQSQAGKSLDEIKAAELPEKNKDWGRGFICVPLWIETVYRSWAK